MSKQSLPSYPFLLTCLCQTSLSHYLQWFNRGGRGDRIGRYGNNHNDHNFRDMDYRGYGQEDEEAGAGYDVRAEGAGPYGRDEQPLGGPDFPPGRLQDRPGFHKRGDGRGDVAHEGKGLPWPPCSQLRPDLALPLLQREEDGPRREFEQLQTGLQQKGRGKGGRGFPENSGPHSGSKECNWSRGGAHSEEMDYNTARPRDEDRFSRGGMKRRVSYRKFILFIELLQFCFVVDICCSFLTLLCSLFQPGQRSMVAGAVVRTCPLRSWIRGTRTTVQI